MAYTSSSLAGIQAAVAAGLGLSILSEIAIQADHRVLTAKDGFAPIDKTEVALVASPDASPATLRLADRLAEFCNMCRRRRRKFQLNSSAKPRSRASGCRRAHAP
jgi:DNA-binding transcriptional LysR family regulator